MKNKLKKLSILALLLYGCYLTIYMATLNPIPVQIFAAICCVVGTLMWIGGTLKLL